MPRALHSRQRLRRLITDAWVRPGQWWARLPGEWAQRLSERFHPDLSDADVQAFNRSLVVREAMWRLRYAGWDQLVGRNEWFGGRAADALMSLSSGPARIVFAHSYSARAVFETAKSLGWRTVLGQIDPGEEHVHVANRASANLPEFGPPPGPPPAVYFESWREECRLADWIVVNSEWSRDSLARAGVAPAKLRVVPLAYEPEGGEPPVTRAYPAAFSRARPLRLLFVGHVAVVKGAAALLEAVAQLDDVPVELSLVGAEAMTVPARFRQHPSIRWVGAVSRREVMRHYRDADVLVYPTLSDGFGMAQVEAQGWHLPIIASGCCGRVVDDGVNGLLLDEVSAASIAGAIRRVAAEPALLAAFARASRTRHGRGMRELADALIALEPS